MLSKPRLWIFGTSGSGKSALCNALIDDRTRRTFPENKPSRSTNRELINQVPVTLLTGQEVQIFDTEGFSNSDIPEQSLYDRTHEVLRAIKAINRFVIVLNSAEPRLDTKTQKMISLFVEMAGDGILNNLSVVFTRWGYDSRSIKARERQKVSEASKTDEINSFFRTKHNHSGSVPCFFVDSSFEENDEGADRCVEQLRLLIESCVNSSLFQTSSIQKVNVNPVINYNNYSNSESGDAYNRKMAARKKAISKIEQYFDNRDLESAPSLINDIYRVSQRINHRDESNWVSEQNYKALITSNLSQQLYEPVQFNLNKILEEGLNKGNVQFSLRKDFLKIDQEQKENIILNERSGLALVLGILFGVVLRLIFGLNWFIAIPVGIIIGLGGYILYSKKSWNVDQTNAQIATAATQKIGYNNGLKQDVINFADDHLGKQN